LEDDDDLLRAIARVEPRLPVKEPTRIGRYEILRRLGRGGMGIVYEARDTRLDRIIALKVLPPELEQDADRRERLVGEARSAALVAHPNVAAIYEVGEDEARVFVAMELVRGETLGATLGAGTPLAIERVLAIVIQIARALEHAHAQGVIHRDLKPDNVMLTEGGVVKVLDFGLAKRLRLETDPSIETSTSSAISALTTAGRLVGTPAYMSPEQALGRSTDARTDVFAFGVVLYEMLTGVLPFQGLSSMETIVSLTRDEPVPPSKHRAEVSAELERFVLRCLAKASSARFSSGGELRRALELVPHSRAVLSRRAAVLLGAIVALVVVVALVRPGRSAEPLATAASVAWSAAPPRATPDAERIVEPIQLAVAEPSALPSVTGPRKVVVASPTHADAAPPPSARDPLSDQK
jgi:eukaryotic-like serine/threonine-protein kinase